MGADRVTGSAENADVEGKIAALLLRQRDRKGTGLSICPTQVARPLAENEGKPEQWRRWLPAVRSGAIRMARRNDLRILRRGKPVDLKAFKGIYRLALPPSGDGQSSDE